MVRVLLSFGTWMVVLSDIVRVRMKERDNLRTDNGIRGISGGFVRVCYVSCPLRVLSYLAYLI